MVFFGMPVGLGLGRDHEPHYGRREGMVLMPYDPLWVGQLAGLHTLEGQDCGTGGRPTGYSLCKGSIPLGGSPRLLSVARALLPKRVFYLEGGGRKPGQWERARARVRQTWGFFMDVYSGEAYGRRVRVFQVLFVLMVCINCLLFQGVRTLRKEHYLWDYQFMYHIA